jgi:hypothetical protein
MLAIDISDSHRTTELTSTATKIQEKKKKERKGFSPHILIPVLNTQGSLGSLGRCEVVPLVTLRLSHTC